MKRLILGTLTAIAILLLLSLPCFARDVQPIVSTDWIEKNMGNAKLVIVDIRKVEDYRAGHIPGAINVFYGAWAVTRGGLDNEIPADSDLVDLLSSNGIASDAWVVVVGQADNATDRVNRTRVAWTLVYAGVENVAVLDGGHNKWIAEKKALSTDIVKAKSKPYRGKFNKTVLANKGTVMSSLGKATIVDVRDSEIYDGKTKVSSVAKAGHIKGALNLPTTPVFNADGTYKDKAELAAMAYKVVGSDLSREIIVYCNTGRESSTWWYLLSQVLGYSNVKNYEGSMREWSKDPNAAIAP